MQDANKNKPELMPEDIRKILLNDVLGQDEVLQYVSVAIFKHRLGEQFGNLLMIGNSGTGKTTIMKALEKMYLNHPFFEKFRVVVRVNANVLIEEDNVEQKGQKLMNILEDRARSILGNSFDENTLQEYMQNATVCVDEVDKIASQVGGKPNVAGLSIQHSLLTFMEGEKILHRTKVFQNNQYKNVGFTVDTSQMLFICGGAFETIYDQVANRVMKENGDILKMVYYSDGSVDLVKMFSLKEHIRMEDFFEYGMVPQFISRFDSTLVLSELNIEILKNIFLEPEDSVFKTSQRFFAKFGIELNIEQNAITLIAQQASKNIRIGARALKEIYNKVIKKYEYDPFSSGQIKQTEKGNELLITELFVKSRLGIKT